MSFLDFSTLPKINQIRPLRSIL